MIGCDVIEVERVENSLKKEGFVKAILTESEIEYCKKFKNFYSHVAGFFCAKESVMKALEDCRQISFLDIEICHFETGKPFVKLYGKAKQVFESKKYKNIEISISQTNTIAMAMCEVR